MEPYFNPQVRWWERANRLKVHFHASVNMDGRVSDVVILDVSETGCFIETNLNPNLNQSLGIELNVNGFKFSSSSVVVRVNSNPKGFGLRFDQLSSLQRKEIRKILKSLSEPKSQAA
jgi:hypothetical protein